MEPDHGPGAASGDDHRGGVERTVVVGNRQLVIRPAEPADVDGLMALYQALDRDDRHRRFFGSYHPPRSFFEEMVGPGEHGGARLVAVMTGTDGAAQIVGEAGYVRLANGDGELGMAVGRAYRGWLGPYLLDALIETAAAAGVPNLEADVLAVNGPMLAALRARGAAVMDHEGWRVVRLLIGTSGRTPTWPGRHDRPRVLVEGSGGRWHAEDDARAAGLQVIACPGPPASVHGCPVLRGETCPLAAGADVIVVSHPSDDERWPRLLAAHADAHPGVPVCLEPSDDRDVDVPGMPGVTRCPVTAAPDVVGFVATLARRP